LVMLLSNFWPFKFRSSRDFMFLPYKIPLDPPFPKGEGEKIETREKNFSSRQLQRILHFCSPL
jgi:hypothetical protein